MQYEIVSWLCKIAKLQEKERKSDSFGIIFDCRSAETRCESFFTFIYLFLFEFQFARRRRVNDVHLRRVSDLHAGRGYYYIRMRFSNDRSQFRSKILCT